MQLPKFFIVRKIGYSIKVLKKKYCKILLYRFLEREIQSSARSFLNCQEKIFLVGHFSNIKRIIQRILIQQPNMSSMTFRIYEMTQFYRCFGSFHFKRL